MKTEHKSKKAFVGVKISHCVMCGKTLDSDYDHENSCRECE